MASFYRATVEQFLTESVEHVLARLEVAYANRGYTSQYSDQILAWQRDISLLRQSLGECVARSESSRSWGLLLEFSIPRKELRLDAVLLIQGSIVVLEAKTGPAASHAKRQIEEYSLLSHYFHKASNERRIVPILISNEVSSDTIAVKLIESNARALDSQSFAHWVGSVERRTWQSLPSLLLAIEEPCDDQMLAEVWDNSPYFPIPSILEAATALRSGLSIREIAHSEASEHEIENVRRVVQSCVVRARAEHHHAICFLTGVPGSGKTLVGLSLAHSAENKADAIHFMSGNGPLVQVLQFLFTQESRRGGASAVQARTEAKTLIENVHVFARYHTEDNPGPPSNHAIIFDEAQRAWNRAQNLRKFKRDYSEPEMLLRIMERHRDWAVVVALVGGGQEINDEEAGLEEWGRALGDSKKEWVICASPEVLQGGASTAGHRLFENATQQRPVETNTALHLRTSNRSLRAEQLATWVNFMLEGNAEGATCLRIGEKFPMLLSRSLQQTRLKLREYGIGKNRYGLVGSSGAARLRGEGLEPSSSFHAEYPWEHWYLAKETDVRSSYRCEVFATEFEIQGLELDWIGLCWGGDFVWDERHGWLLRKLQHGAQSKWRDIESS
jgi:hypothetical protein